MPVRDQSEYYVFLSHNTKDCSIVKAISEQLEAKGVAIWIDTERINGERFEEKIVAAMKQAKANIIFCGTHGLGRWQKVEVPYASKLDTEKAIPAIIVLLPGADEEKVLDTIGLLATKSFISFRTETDESAMDRLLFSLQAVDDLASEKNLCYLQLRDLLANKHWQLADLETYEMMIQALGKQSGETFGREELLDFPYTDLQTIDRLWVKYSGGRFGFSVQKQIYVECGARLDGECPDPKTWHTFCERVGWQLNGKSVEAMFNLSAPLGHLPFKDKQVSLRFSAYGNFHGYDLLCTALLSHQGL